MWASAAKKMRAAFEYFIDAGTGWMCLSNKMHCVASFSSGAWEDPRESKMHWGLNHDLSSQRNRSIAVRSDDGEESTFVQSACRKERGQ